MVAYRARGACPICGAYLASGANRCTRCGVPVQANAIENAERLEGAIRASIAIGWRLSIRELTWAELVSPGGADHLYLQIQADGSVTQQVVSASGAHRDQPYVYGSGQVARLAPNRYLASQVRPLAPALLQLFGWFGFLGIGYLVQGRIAAGIAMLVGWWAVFWVLLFATLISFGIFGILMWAIWLVAPPASAAFLYFEREMIGGHV